MRLVAACPARPPTVRPPAPPSDLLLAAPLPVQGSRDQARPPGLERWQPDPWRRPPGPRCSARSTSPPIEPRSSTQARRRSQASAPRPSRDWMSCTAGRLRARDLPGRAQSNHALSKDSQSPRPPLAAGRQPAHSSAKSKKYRLAWRPGSPEFGLARRRSHPRVRSSLARQRLRRRRCLA